MLLYGVVLTFRVALYDEGADAEREVGEAPVVVPGRRNKRKKREKRKKERRRSGAFTQH
jgi:hypothetical protein